VKTKETMLQIIFILIMVLMGSCTQAARAEDNSADTFEVELVQQTPVEIDEKIMAEIMPVLDAMVGSGSRKAVIEYITTPCTHADGLGGPPKCKDEQEEGTLVEVFPILFGEGSFVEPADINRSLEIMIKDLYAVYRVEQPEHPEAYWPSGNYALLFERTQNDIPFPVTAYVKDGKIVRLMFSIGMTPAEILSGIPLEQILIPPDEAQALTEFVLNTGR